MRQNGVIFLALGIGFVVFITLRNELKTYLQVLGIVPGISGPSSLVGNVGAAIGNAIGGSDSSNKSSASGGLGATLPFGSVLGSTGNTGTFSGVPVAGGILNQLLGWLP